MAEAHKENGDVVEDYEIYGEEDAFVFAGAAVKNRKGKGARYEESKNAANKRHKKNTNNISLTYLFMHINSQNSSNSLSMSLSPTQPSPPFNNLFLHSNSHELSPPTTLISPAPPTFSFQCHDLLSQQIKRSRYDITSPQSIYFFFF